MENIELNHYKVICYIQNKFIRGEISREEVEQKLEIERLKFIDLLRKCNEVLVQQMDGEKKIKEFIDTLK